MFIAPLKRCCLLMKYMDDHFEQFAEGFIGNMEGDGDIPFRDKLNSQALDYSLSSLNEVNQYLKFLHQRMFNDARPEYQHVVVWCGAYVGEVIRKNATMKYHWVLHEDYMKDKAENMKNLLPYTLGTHALLMVADGSYISMPVNKVARYLEEGEENDVHFYVAGDISRSNKNEPLQTETNKTTGQSSKPWWKFW